MILGKMLTHQKKQVYVSGTAKPQRVFETFVSSSVERIFDTIHHLMTQMIFDRFDSEIASKLEVFFRAAVASSMLVNVQKRKNFTSKILLLSPV